MTEGTFSISVNTCAYVVHSDGTRVSFDFRAVPRALWTGGDRIGDYPVRTIRANGT